MDEVKKRRFLGGLLFAAMASLCFGIFYGAYHGPWDPRLRSYLQERYAAPPPAPPPPIQKDRVTLTQGQPVTVGRNKIVFYGVEDDAYLMAVYLLELDPDRAYYHRIPQKDAREGFTLGGQEFALISRSERRIQLRMSGELFE